MKCGIFSLNINILISIKLMILSNYTSLLVGCFSHKNIFGGKNELNLSGWTQETTFIKHESSFLALEIITISARGPLASFLQEL